MNPIENDLRRMLLEYCGTDNRLELVLRGGAVVRYHAEPNLRKQTVSDHTWRMMVILHHLWPEADKLLLLAALYHDATEGVTGDVPAPIKRMEEVNGAYALLDKFLGHYLTLPDERALGPLDKVRLKCADYLELCLTCAEQSPTPNALRVMFKGAGYVTEQADKLPEEERKEVLNLLFMFTKGTNRG